MKKVITIDGPSGVGKGTVARVLATKLGWNLLDSGAIYRALAYLAQAQEIALDNEEQLVDLASGMNLYFEAVTDQELLSVYLDDIEVSQQLRTQACGELASQVAKLTKVRLALLQRQRGFATNKGLIADGRDMGTVVFPDADYKIFLTASANERAKRRLKQLQSSINHDKITAFLDNSEYYISSDNADMLALVKQFALIKSEILARDERDKTRVSSPLKPANNAVIIDTTLLNINQVIERIKQIINT